MRWAGRRESGNIEDRRNMRAGPMVIGGGGLMTVVMIVVALALGINPQQLLENMPPGALDGAPGANVQIAEDDPRTKELVSFVGVVLADTEDVWTELFQREVGKPYSKPKLVLFSDGVESACGFAGSSVGPFYCPGDNNVYLDLLFFEQMRTRFQAPGDFAMAYVIAHEVGHHVQNLLGLSTQVQKLQQRANKVESNNWSVRLELQADFLAGVWAHHAQKSKQILEVGDIEEAINAAQAIGDDTLQKRSRGQVVPDAFTHGTSAQRIRWFTRGMKSGKFDDLKLLFEMEYDQL